MMMTGVDANSAIRCRCITASSLAVSQGEQGTKTFSATEFREVMRTSSFIGAVTFWRALERLADPESRTRLLAMALLAELARSSFAACEGMAYSPQQAECFEYCGLTPRGMRPPGSAGTIT
jgi:hypothetical protein